MTRAKRVERLAKQMAVQLDGLSEVDAQRAAAFAVAVFDNDVEDAAAYRWLRDEIIKTMPDPDAWDGDEAEEAILARYVEHLADATHGECASCSITVPAGAGYERIGPRIICMECA